MSKYALKRHVKPDNIPTVKYGVLTERHHKLKSPLLVCKNDNGWFIGCLLNNGTIIQESIEFYRSATSAGFAYNNTTWSQKKFL
jgi:hypothetical protein